MSLAPCTERSIARATSAVAFPNASSVWSREHARSIAGTGSEEIMVSMSSESFAVNGKET